MCLDLSKARLSCLQDKSVYKCMVVVMYSTQTINERQKFIIKKMTKMSALTKNIVQNAQSVSKDR